MVKAVHLIAVLVVWGGSSMWVAAQTEEPPAPPKQQPAPQAPPGFPQETSPDTQPADAPAEQPAEALPEGPLPTYSLEIVAINGDPIAAGPQAEFTVSPGDVFTAKIFVRDWSIYDNKLRSFQVTLDPSSFQSGQSGKIEPVNYGSGENEENAFIDESDPRYVHRGLHTIPAVDTSGADYRWLSVLYNVMESPLSLMDGTKYSCGVMHMRVSDDASGTFAIKLHDNPDLTMMLNVNNEPIPFMQVEPLVLNVATAGEWLRIRSSSPANGSVAAQLLANDQKACPWDSIRLMSAGQASGLKTEDFEVTDGTGNPPRIERIEMDPKNPGTAILRFSRGITPGRWTKVIHKSSQSSASIGCLPGDVNSDAVLNGRDVTALIEVLNGQRRLGPEQTDLNGDGKTTTADLSSLVDLLASGPAVPTGTRIASRE